MKRWCDQCRSHGHTKWLFLGTHTTHRAYMRYRIWQTVRRYQKLSQEHDDSTQS